jgi:hypothetical protein
MPKRRKSLKNIRLSKPETIKAGPAMGRPFALIRVFREATQRATTRPQRRDLQIA